jgi:hypothetical protein
MAVIETSNPMARLLIQFAILIRTSPFGTGLDSQRSDLQTICRESEAGKGEISQLKLKPNCTLFTALNVQNHRYQGRSRRLLDAIDCLSQRAPPQNEAEGNRKDGANRESARSVPADTFGGF